MSLRSSRPSPQPRARFAGAAFAALALLVAGSTEVIAGPVQRPWSDLAVASAPPAVRPASGSVRVVTLQDLIDEAARRFGVPTSWIAEVMAVESRGRAGALSPKGAIGLMQVMPETYAGLRLRYGLGADPWDPRDNVLAGAAYLRELYDRYGAPGFLVAYNAGPGRWDDYRLRARPLPAETVAYLARLGPVVGGSVLPLPTFAGAPAVRSPFATPIFVALSTDPARLQVAAERARIVRIVEANASVVGRADAIFVTRTRPVNLPPDASSTSGRGADETPSERSANDRPTVSLPPPNPLFPSRFGTEIQR